MIIKFKEYTLSPDVICVERFNLSRTITATATQNLKSGTKEGETYDREEESGYGMTLESAIQKIITYELIKKDNVVDLKRYLAEYRKVKKEIFDLLDA